MSGANCPSNLQLFACPIPSSGLGSVSANDDAIRNETDLKAIEFWTCDFDGKEVAGCKLHLGAFRLKEHLALRRLNTRKEESKL